MNIPQNLQMKLTFMVFTLLIAVVISGAASAGLVLPEQSYTSAYVVETGYSFTGPASIQDAADNYETTDGDHVLLQPGNHDEQVVVNKNLTFTGMGTNPEDTVIQATNDNGGTVTIANGVSVVMENLTIWNYGTGPVIVNNGQLTIINCLVNGTYVANEVMEIAAGGTLTSEGTITPESTTETMLITSEEGTTETTGTPGTTETLSAAAVEMDGTPTGTTTEPATTETLTTDNVTGTTNQKTDPGIPLASLASGMLMIMGGTVISGRKEN